MADPHGVPRKRQIFTPDHDFTIIVYDSVVQQLTDANGVKTVEHVPIKAYEYDVSRAVLSFIPYFRAIFAPSGFRDTGQKFHRLPEDDPLAWKIWLQILHDSLDSSSYDVGITTVWNVLVIAHKYEISPKRADAKQWFADWYDHWGHPQRLEDCSEALYPCHTFDHAKGFARASKILAYEGDGHGIEQRPDGIDDYHLHLDHRIIQQIQAARGRLKTILYRGLHAPIKAMLNDESNQCQYKYKVLWAFEKGLVATGTWPEGEVSARASIDDIISRLRRFSYEDPHPGGTSSCFRCKGNFERIVRAAIETALDYFDGLCLDCMYSSKTGDRDKDYWQYVSSKSSTKFGLIYDKGCRMDHDEPSWYFSFMGARKDFDEWKFARNNQEFTFRA